MGRHDKNAEIVRTIVMLGNSLGLQVVAEGVEDDSQLQFLKSLQCPFAQGFLFCKPVAHAAAIAHLVASPQSRVTA